MKAVLITTINRPMLAARYLVDVDDYDDMLPIGYYLVTDFGNDEKFDTLTTDNLNALFDIGPELENNGFFEVTRK